MTTDRWSRHAAALAPLTAGLPGALPAVTRLLSAFADDARAAGDFLQWQGLAGWWSAHVEADDAGADLLSAHAGFAKPLADCRRQAVAHQLLQEAAMQALSAALEQAGIGYVWLKTAGVRRILYDTPGQRPSTDIDLLVHPEQRVAARHVIEAFGGRAWTSPSRSRHELAFSKGQVDIDLHWDVLAPGRLHGAVVDDLLERRVAAAFGYRLEDNDVLFVALCHLAFAKYVCSPHAGLNRVLDILAAAQRLRIDVAVVATRLHRARAATAAWAVLHWIAMLTATLPPALVVLEQRLAPGPGRARYLHRWIASAWPRRLTGGGEVIIQLAFTLPLHDTVGDAVRAVRHRLAGSVSVAG